MGFSPLVVKIYNLINNFIRISYHGSDLVVTAVATKAATRRIAGLLIERGTRNIVFPLNTL